MTRPRPPADRPRTLSDAEEPDRHAGWLALASASPLEAIAVLDDALAAARRAGEVRDQIALRRALGMAERSRMRLTASMDHLHQAIALSEQLGDVEAAAHCRSTLAGTLMYAGRATESLAMMTRVVADLPEPDRSQAEAQRVPILSLAGFHREALSASDALLEQFQDPSVAVWGARVRQSRSMIHLYLGDPQAGICDAEAAIAIYTSLGNEAGVARTRHNVAALRGLAGDVLGSMEMFADVEAEFRRLGMPVSLGADGRVATLFAAGLAEDAAQEAQTAMRDCEAQGADGLLVEATVWHALALAHLGRWDQAARSAALAVRAFAAQERPAWQAFAAALEVEARVGGLTGATLACLAHGDVGTVDTVDRVGTWSAAARAAASDMRAHGWVQATRADVLAALLAAAQGSDVGHLRALGSLRAAGLIEHQLLGWLALGAAEVLEDTSEAGLIRAAATWREGAVIGRDLPDAVSTLDGNLVVNSLRHTLTSVGVAALIRAGAHGEALAWLEEERATPAVARLHPGTDQTEERLLSELRAIRLQSAAPGSEDGVHRLLQRQADVERSLRERSLRRIHRASVTDPQVASDTLEVSYFVDDGTVIALVGIDGRAVKHVVGPLSAVQRLSQSARRGAERLSLGADHWKTVVDALANDLDELDALLIGGWATAQPDRTVRISAPPELDVAWTSLSSLRRRPVALVGSLHERPVIDHTWQGDGEVVAIAGPGLVHATREIGAIGLARSARLLTGSAADREGVCHALATAHTVHLACHATLRHDQPLFSSLELWDGPLFLHDLARSGRVAPVIVLSACSAGRASSRASGGAAGFARTLRGLGAEVVLAPHVPVNDELVVAPMVALHRLFAQGVPAATAMAQVRTDRDLSPAEAFTAAVCSPFSAGIGSPRLP